MKYPLNWIAPASGALGLALFAATPAWTAGDPCVAQAQKEKTIQGALLKAAGGSGGPLVIETDDGKKGDVTWKADGSCEYGRGQPGMRISYPCREEHYLKAILAICTARAKQAAQRDEGLEKTRTNLINDLRNHAMSQELIDRYTDFTRDNRAMDLREVDKALEIGMIRYGAQVLDRPGARVPGKTPHALLEADPLYLSAQDAWGKRKNISNEEALKGMKVALANQADVLQKTNKMKEETKRRADEFAATKAELDREAAKKAAEVAAKARECAEWQQMLDENDCKRNASLTTCTVPRANRLRLGC